jgi:hypothetical protein
VNERIQKLMGKTLDSEFSHTWDTMTYEGLLQFSEKFAELIVQECISTLEEKIYRSIDHEGDECWIDLILKEHFGVEE